MTKTEDKHQKGKLQWYWGEGFSSSKEGVKKGGGRGKGRATVFGRLLTSEGGEVLLRGVVKVHLFQRLILNLFGKKGGKKTMGYQDIQENSGN